MTVTQPTYKYRREDFDELPVALDHLTIYLNFCDNMVEATNVMDITARVPLDQIALDAKALEIVSVEWLDPSAPPDEAGHGLVYEYRAAESRLVVRLPRSIPVQERFRIRTVTRCYPSDDLLEGIYKDTTPPGAPQQYMSQCQQWGFQRIMPIFDDCRAKCTMTTTLEADAAYTHLISNGNISRDLNPEGVPIPKPGDPRRQIIRYENPIPMAPYLFLACCGTWDMLADQVTLDSGSKVNLEYLVPPGRVDHVRIPMDILKQSVLWISRTQAYDYTGDTYRTICMNKSNFGGMENMGNTTIVTDAALIDEHTLDFTLLYVHAVIVHEFEHNQCGSETTMDTPFDVWLNEAYTVDVERQFMADVFDPSFVRLTQVDSIRHPTQGPLAIEDGGRAGRIVREAFNDPDELIDGVTYVKAAEVIRMLRLIVGKENFLAGKRLYFSRYQYGNANTDQFFQCFEEVSGRSLEQFKKTWLHTIGYPEVSVSTQYDPQQERFTVRFSQQTGNNPPFHVPVAIALADREGSTIPGTDTIFELSRETGSVTFENIREAPAFPSLNRDYSFYGTLKHDDADFHTLAIQARVDTNFFNRVEAMRQLTDRVRINALLNPKSRIDARWLDLYGEILSDRSLPSALKAYLLRIDEQPLDRRYCAWYRELVACREALMFAVNRAYRDRLQGLFLDLDTYKPRHSPKDGIEDRILKHVLLDLTVVDDSPESHRLILDHYHAATTNSDRVSALLALNRSSAEERRELLEQTYDAWHPHLSGYANYLRIIGSGTRDDAFDLIEAEKRRPSFDLRQPTWSRALFLSMAGNNKMVWTDRGIDWLADTVIELSRVNWFTGSRLLNTFQQVRRLKPEVQATVKAALQRIVEGVPQQVSPALHAQALGYVE
jgi:aminopeptidase N